MDEYIEKIILKGENNKKYKIYTHVPFENISFHLIEKILSREIALDLEKQSRWSIYQPKNGFDIIIYKTEHFYNMCIEFNDASVVILTHILLNMNKQDYIDYIKKIGEYFSWRDHEEKLSENIEKKQLTLFNILINKI
jgi:hypothetical protein